MNARAGWIKSDWVERALAGLGAAACLILTLVIWASVGRWQETWPLPDLYFVEVVALAAAAAWGIFRRDPGGSLLAWAAVGALVGFAILAGFSVGLFYLPVTAVLGLAALWHDRRAWRQLPLHLGLALLAAVAQAALMLAVIRVFYPSPVA